MLSVDLSSFGEMSSILTAALHSLERGWSVIPLIGGEDAQTGKRPLKPWQPYQERLPAKAEVQRWFRSPELTAYGVVCGRISQIVVIDLDTKEAEEQFAGLFPHLLDTFTVRSGFRKTPHL
jgi:hypothetical protein